MRRPDLGPFRDLQAAAASAVDGRLEASAGLELRGQGGLRLDGLARARVAGLAGGALGHQEGAEADQADFVARLEGGGDRLEDGVDGRAGLRLGEVRGLGDGGDELFAGYTRYREALEQPFVAPAPIRALARGAVSLLPQSARGRNYLLNLTRASRGRYASMVAQPLSAREGGIARAEISRLLPAFDRLLDSWFDAAAFRDFATQMTMVDLQTYLPGDILTKVDRTSMAVSLEARVPLLDHPLIEFAAALPIGAKMRGSEGKWLLRNAITDLVPPRVLVKQKQGFGVPLDHWFRGPLSGRLRSLTANGSPIHEYVAVEGVQRLVREHTSGRRNHMGRLWRLVALQGWLAALSRGDLARPTSLMRVLPGIGREDTRYT